MGGESEASQAVAAAGALVRGRVVVISLDDPDREVELPPSVVRVLAEVLEHAGRGEPVRRGSAGGVTPISSRTCRPGGDPVAQGRYPPPSSFGRCHALSGDRPGTTVGRGAGLGCRSAGARPLLTVGRAVVVLDANVLYPARLRDLFMRLAIGGLYQARWSDRILDECFTNLAANRPDIRPGSLVRTRALMNVAIPDAIVTGYEPQVDGLDLPDLDDRHVLAAAIRSGATSIVTANLADFPRDVLARYGIEPLAPDEFVLRLVHQDLDAVVEVVDRQAADLRNPPMSTAELLDGLRGAGLTRTVAGLLSGTA